MNNNSRRIVESPIYFGEDAARPFALTVSTTWATNPTSPVFIIYDAAGTDVTATTTTGTNATASGQIITVAKVTGRLYRVRNALPGAGITKGLRYPFVIRFTTPDGEESCFGEFIGQI